MKSILEIINSHIERLRYDPKSSFANRGTPARLKKGKMTQMLFFKSTDRNEKVKVPARL